MQATYSPEDNKLRLYPDTRLDEVFRELATEWKRVDSEPHEVYYYRVVDSDTGEVVSKGEA